jgi:hypothetical protein
VAGPASRTPVRRREQPRLQLPEGDLVVRRRREQVAIGVEGHLDRAMAHERLHALRRKPFSYIFSMVRAPLNDSVRLAAAKRLADPYKPRVRWLKIKNPDYSQKEGRSDLFNGPSRSAL